MTGLSRGEHGLNKKGVFLTEQSRLLARFRLLYEMAGSYLVSVASYGAEEDKVVSRAIKRSAEPSEVFPNRCKHRVQALESLLPARTFVSRYLVDIA